jgi:hypothetical protein
MADEAVDFRHRTPIEWEVAAALPDNAVELIGTLEMAFTRNNIPLEKVYYRLALPSETEKGIYMLHLYNLKEEDNG